MVQPPLAQISALGARPGTYALILYLHAPKNLQIGRLGGFDFAAGYYIYVGSAFGPGGLAARLGRHIKGPSKPHWHIDYLRDETVLEQVLCTTQNLRREHAWADVWYQLSPHPLPAPGFGASDCRCPAHLFYMPQAPDRQSFIQTLKTCYPEDDPVIRIHFDGSHR